MAKASRFWWTSTAFVTSDKYGTNGRLPTLRGSHARPSAKAEQLVLIAPASCKLTAEGGGVATGNLGGAWSENDGAPEHQPTQPALKVLHLLSDWKLTGPSEPVVTLCAQLQRRGHDVTLAYRTPPSDATK